MKVHIKENGKKKKFEVISKWSEVSLEQWVKLLEIKGVSKSDEARKTILALSNIPEKLLDSLELYHIVMIMQSLSSMQKEDNSSLREVIEVDGIEYGFHPDLESITLGEYADLEVYLKDVNKNMPEIMAILFRPIVAKEGGFYQIEAYDGEIKLRAEVMRKIPAEKVQDALVFFYHLGALLLPTLLSCSIRGLQETRKQ